MGIIIMNICGQYNNGSKSETNYLGIERSRKSRKERCKNSAEDKG